MSNLSDVSNIISDYLTPEPELKDSGINLFPLIGLGLVLLSGSVTLGAAYFFLSH
jgi:hypothetical protein